MEFDAVLRLKKTKKGTEHSVEFINQKGKTVIFVVHERARYYNDTAADGDACKIEVEGSNILKCVIGGKEAEPKAVTPKDAPKTPAGKSGGYFPKAAAKPAGRNAPVTGTAPYNFVRYRDDAVLAPRQGEPRKWSGEIICNLTALTPLLISGRQEKTQTAAGDCKFMNVGGKNIIPGTSIKGMLRSLMEILSFSGLRPVSRKRLFWREVAETEYREFFPEEPLGGFLRKHGADYCLFQARVTPCDANAPKTQGSEKVSTGGFVRNGKKSRAYYFELPAGNAQRVPVEREVVLRFLSQMTPNQEKRWSGEERAKRLGKNPGLPVFFRLDADGKIAELGFCRYFRLEYKYSPFELAWPNGDDDVPDMATAIFGHVGRKSMAGRVAIEPFAIEGKEYAQGGVNVVLGGPKPTCLPFYLVQNPQEIKVISYGKKNERSSMRNYNEKSSRLRGRKLYWHHDPDPAYFPRGNDNVKTTSCLHPLAAGAQGKFVIHLNRLTDTELGCLLEALELPEGCAHKLGMGKSLGFGSSQISVKAANLTDCTQKYLSLAERLRQPAPEPMPEAKRKELREKFRSYVYEGMKAAWKEASPRDFYGLPPIADLLIMLNYAKRPAPSQVRTMDLKQFGANPLLPAPEQVIGGRR